MSCNKNKPHILVLPEDRANRQIANGFILDLNLNDRSIQILPPAGGWKRVVDAFKDVHARNLEKYSERRIVLLIDFDRQFKGRFNRIQKVIPRELSKRVFVLGVLSEPEDLRINIRKSFEDIGKALSEDCVEDTRNLWGHDFLRHNEPELERMISSVKPFLFN